MRGAGSGMQHAFVGTCTDCGSRMVEYAATTGGEMRTIQLECETKSCETVGRVRHALEQGGLDDPEVQEGVTDLRSAEVNWINCPRCHGSGWVNGGIGDLERAMGGRDTPCRRCHTSGAVLGEVREIGGGDGGE